MGGCNGKAGSTLQLNNCIPGASNQQFEYSPNSSIKFSAIGEDQQLCIAVPPRGASGGMDRHSIIADPLFADPDVGDFNLNPKSPAFNLGFKPIPKIQAPISKCGVHAQESCLKSFLFGKNISIHF